LRLITDAPTKIGKCRKDKFHASLSSYYNLGYDNNRYSYEMKSQYYVFINR